jgi:hypothetical protein
MTTATKTKTISPATAKAFSLGTTPADSILSAIKQAANHHGGFIAIENYVDGNGRITNRLLTTFGGGTYHKLISESIDAVLDNSVALPSTIDGMDIDAATWNQAIVEQLQSWRKSLTGGHGRKDTKSAVKTDDGDTQRGFYERDGIACLANIRIVKTSETDEQKAYNELGKADGSVKLKKGPKSALAKAKAYLRNETPVGAYQGEFKLAPDRFSRIAFSGTAINVDAASIGQLVQAD